MSNKTLIQSQFVSITNHNQCHLQIINQQQEKKKSRDFFGGKNSPACDCRGRDRSAFPGISDCAARQPTWSCGRRRRSFGVGAAGWGSHGRCLSPALAPPFSSLPSSHLARDDLIWQKRVEFILF